MAALRAVLLVALCAGAALALEVGTARTIDRIARSLRLRCLVACARRTTEWMSTT
jgi:hypothetical protein